MLVIPDYVTLQIKVVRFLNDVETDVVSVESETFVTLLLKEVWNKMLEKDAYN